MAARFWWRTRRTAEALVVVAVVMLVGCGGGMDFGPSVRVPADQRQVVDASVVGKDVNLPKEQPFNIHVKQSSQNPGAGGTAQGSADANGWGEASCSAQVANGGSATGEFHLGQAIDFRGATPVKVSVRLSFKLTHELIAEPIAAGTQAQLSLAVSVRDATGRVNPKIAIETLSSDDAPGKGVRSDGREFSFVMEPGGSYQIVFDGSLSAASEARGAATAKMAISNMQMVIAFSPAPAAPTPTTATAPAEK